MNDGLDALEDLRPLRRIFESVYKKTKYYFNCLICFLTETIRLQVVGYVVK